MRLVITFGIFLATVSLCVEGSEEDSLFNVPAAEYAQRFGGIPLIHNYSTDDFGRDAQYWDILQLAGGEMVFGSHRGVNFYNGHQGYFFGPPGDHVFSLTKGLDGKLYIGGLNEIGQLSLDGSGNFSYSSLRSYIPEQCLDFSSVWQSISTYDGIYFRSPDYLFYWDYETMSVWKPETRFNFLGSVHNKIFVWQENRGLFELKDGKFTLLPNGDIFAKHFVRALLAYDDELILIGTRTDGFYLFDGTSFERWETNAQTYITNNVLYTGSVLPDGSFAFGTLQGGVVIIERNGRTRNIFDRETGLQDQSVICTYVDRGGSLWLGLQNGLTRIEPMLPVTKFDERTGIKDLVLSFKEHEGILYAGTISGVYKLDPRSVGPKGYGAFRKIQGINSGSRGFTVADGDLLVATDEGIFRIDGDKASFLFSETIRAILASRFDNQMVYAAQQNNIILGRYINGEFTILSESGRITEPKKLAEYDDGSLYVGTRADGVYRLKWEFQLASNGNNNAVLKYSVRIGLPTDWETVEHTHVYYLNGKIRVGTFRGLYKIPEDYTILIPDSLISENFAGGGREVSMIVENNIGELFFRSANNHFVARPTSYGEYAVEQGVLSRIKITQFEVLYRDSFEHVWFGGSVGLYRYDSNAIYDHTRQFDTKISEVQLNSDSLIYRGLLQSGSDNSYRILSYTDNNLRLRFFIPAYEDIHANQYQTKLEPVDEDWSRWTGEAFKDYTNLREGRYSFKVRGRDVYGNVSEAAVFEFRVLPPWYRTWWSYGMAGLIVTLFLLSIHKYRVYRILEVERTRTRIARDLHDDIGSSLSSIALMIDMFSNKETIPEEEKSELSNIGGTARDMVDSLRDVVWVINPEHDNLATLIERMKSTAGNMLHNIDYTFNTDIAGIYESVGMDFKRSVLLIYKEALSNIIKHSRAKNVNIDLREADGLFRMNIADDGIGFDASKSTDGNGLQNMHYRAHQIHGKLIIESIPGKGTTVELKAELI